MTTHYTAPSRIYKCGTPTASPRALCEKHTSAWKELAPFFSAVFWQKGSLDLAWVGGNILGNV